MKDRLKRLWPHAVGLALCLGYVWVLARTSRDLGFARDEGFYFRAATEYARWFELLLRDRATALTRAAVDRHWGINHEHPALMKSLFGLSWLYLHEKWHWLQSESLAFRLPGMVMGGLGLWVTWIFGLRAHSARVGLFAALALGLMPRVFYHSHLDCFDVPVMTMWVAVLYCYWRSLEGGLGWSIATGVMWGLALETKHNAWFVPILVVVHFALTRGGDLRSDAGRGNFPIPLALVAMAVLGPLIFVGLWPWMWFDTLQNASHGPGRFQEYVTFHTQHAYYNMEWLGFNWFHPPFPRSYMWGMILFTVPGATLLLAVVGVATRLPHALRDVRWVAGLVPASVSAPWARSLRAWAAARPDDDRRGTDALILLGMAVPMGPWLSPKTPIFGGTKHWFPAYPFMAILAGVGFAWACRRLEAALARRVEPRWLPAAALGSLMILPAALQTAHSHPFGLSNYTPVAGGAPGAADLGLNRQFWGFTTGSVVPWFNEHLRPQARVYIHDTAPDAWNMLQRDGRLREDIHDTWSISDADAAIVHHELHMNEVDYQVWVAYQSPAVAWVLRYDGVPIVSVYRNPRSR